MAHPSQHGLLFWSSGKDACLALHRSLKSGKYESLRLLTTISSSSLQVPFHGTPESILRAQAKSLNLPLRLVTLSKHCANQEYEDTLLKVLAEEKRNGITEIIFGDLFLSDIRAYREHFLKPLDLGLTFPIWEENTQALAKEIIDLGFKALVTGINPRKLSSSYLGNSFDRGFLESLPEGIDPCGENGEFHTCVSGGPLFKFPLSFKKGKIHHEPTSQWLELSL